MDTHDALQSLNSVSDARRAAHRLRHYGDASSILIAWGLAWLFGFGAQQMIPDLAHIVWTVAWIGALGWSVTRPRKAYDGRAMASWTVAILFIAITIVVTGADLRLAAMLFALALAASYAAIGIWTGIRFLLLGCAVLLAACAGWWLFPQALFAILAIGGGGALIFGGLWLRRP